tara:strand:- start:8 stop:322 length:315 start_codon:yes stop_codon:yes gene_type:complete
MKQIISGKTYNTATATVICDSGNDLPSGDFRSERSELYVTKKGAYFIAGRGGAMGRFSRKSGDDGWIGSEGIIRVTQQEALDEAESKAPSEVVEAFFGDVLEDA